MRQFGLIGYPLSHSFSQNYFTNKFLNEKRNDLAYTNFPIASIQDFKELWNNDSSLEGLNVTIPYKKQVIPFLHHVSQVVKSTKACNCIRQFEHELYGYNTDVIGFEKSLLPFLKPHHTHALILGTGGGSAAVQWVLQKLNITYLFVSRNTLNNKEEKGSNPDKVVGYDMLTADILKQYTLIINTSPVGMFPHVNEAPLIPYDAITPLHHLYDLVYNPSQTLFMEKGLSFGATAQNGLEMLHIQAEESWKIWNAPQPILQ